MNSRKAVHAKTQRIYMNSFIPGRQKRQSSNDAATGESTTKGIVSPFLEEVKEDQIREQMVTERGNTRASKYQVVQGS